MKNILLTAILALAICACGKKSATVVEHDSIVGKWKLTESLMDPGDGSGKWQPADPAHPSYLEFKSDGTLTSNNPTVPTTRYKLTSDSTLLIYRPTDSLSYRYHFAKSTLSLTPPCIEACGMHYAAVK